VYAHLTLPLSLSLPTDPSCRRVHISDLPKSSSRAVFPGATEEHLLPPARDPRPPLGGRGGYIFFVYSVPTHIAARFPNPPDHWLLDRGIVVRGTVVPQKMWSPHSAVERRRYVERAELQLPVFFEDRDRGLGLSLEATLDGPCHVLRDANDTRSVRPNDDGTYPHSREYDFGLLVTC
jgi:hypothetical protein